MSKFRQMARNLQGQASKFIDGISYFRRGDYVVIICRVSHRNQKKNLVAQANNLREVAQKLGLIVIDVVEYIGPGNDPSWLASIAENAKQHDAILFAESTDRFIRSPHYTKFNQDEQARYSELQDLYLYTKGTELVTHLYPDAKLNEVKAYQCERGMNTKQNASEIKPISDEQKLLKEAISKVRKSLPIQRGAGSNKYETSKQTI